MKIKLQRFRCLQPGVGNIRQRQLIHLIVPYLNSTHVSVKSSAPESGTAWIVPPEVDFKTGVRTENSGESFFVLFQFKLAFFCCCISE